MEIGGENIREATRKSWMSVPKARKHTGVYILSVQQIAILRRQKDDEFKRRCNWGSQGLRSRTNDQAGKHLREAAQALRLTC